MKHIYKLPNPNELKKLIAEVNKDLCIERDWPIEKAVLGEEDFQRVISGDYVENHPVDKLIMIALEGFKLSILDTEPDTPVASPS